MPERPTTSRQARAIRHAERLAKQAFRNRCRTYTPQQKQLQQLREARAYYVNCGITERHHYAHWLNALLEDRLAPKIGKRGPYPYGKALGRLYLAHSKAHNGRRSLLAAAV